jgi:hypothetical protein
VAFFVLSPAGMKSRRLTLLVALYVTLDLSNPFMPGAFTFDPDESVEGVSVHYERGQRQHGTVPAPLPVRGEAGETRSVAVVRRSEVRALAEWFVDLRQAHAPASDPRSLTEDH